MDSTVARIEVHQSQLVKFEMCGEAFRRQYIDREPDVAGLPALRGSGVHGAAQTNHRQKKASGKDLPKKDLIDAAVASFEERKAKDGFRLTPEEQSMGVTTAIARTLKTVATLTGLYADRVAPDIQPDLIEETVVIDLPDTNISLGGTIDCTTTERRLKDFKSAVRSKSQRDADESPQLTLYDLLYEKKTGHKATGIDLEVLVDTKTPKHQRITTTRGPRDRAVLFNRINAMLRARETGVFAPAQVGAWNCSEKWCSYWSTCPYVNSERAAASAALEE